MVERKEIRKRTYPFVLHVVAGTWAGLVLIFLLVCVCLGVQPGQLPGWPQIVLIAVLGVVLCATVASLLCTRHRARKPRGLAKGVFLGEFFMCMLVCGAMVVLGCEALQVAVSGSGGAGMSLLLPIGELCVELCSGAAKAFGMTGYGVKGAAWAAVCSSFVLAVLLFVCGVSSLLMLGRYRFVRGALAGLGAVLLCEAAGLVGVYVWSFSVEGVVAVPEMVLGLGLVGIADGVMGLFWLLVGVRLGKMREGHWVLVVLGVVVGCGTLCGCVVVEGTARRDMSESGKLQREVRRMCEMVVAGEGEGEGGGGGGSDTAESVYFVSDNAVTAEKCTAMFEGAMAELCGEGNALHVQHRSSPGTSAPTLHTKTSTITKTNTENDLCTAQMIYDAAVEQLVRNSLAFVRVSTSIGVVSVLTLGSLVYVSLLHFFPRCCYFQNRCKGVPVRRVKGRSEKSLAEREGREEGEGWELPLLEGGSGSRGEEASPSHAYSARCVEMEGEDRSSTPNDLLLPRSSEDRQRRRIGEGQGESGKEKGKEKGKGKEIATKEEKEEEEERMAEEEAAAEDVVSAAYAERVRMRRENAEPLLVIFPELFGVGGGEGGGEGGEGGGEGGCGAGAEGLRKGAELAKEGKRLHREKEQRECEKARKGSMVVDARLKELVLSSLQNRGGDGDGGGEEEGAEGAAGAAGGEGPKEDEESAVLMVLLEESSGGGEEGGWFWQGWGWGWEERWGRKEERWSWGGWGRRQRRRRRGR
ncbi:uncharacterized protein MONOS_13264 [Monocercomonoides exilis]|uniref:uncharacterized protein n=1 Tax=Monocercomonoides exilis TaxID=2049356 RepID=UPI00355AA09F|nr:hypothetical protein MONOS_13264 [Monocercomonoides exilis]